MDGLLGDPIDSQTAVARFVSDGELSYRVILWKRQHVFLVGIARTSSPQVGIRRGMDAGPGLIGVGLEKYPRNGISYPQFVGRK